MTGTYKDIAVYIDPGQNHQKVYEAISLLAKGSDFHVNGVYALAPFPTLTSEGLIPASVLQQYNESCAAVAEEHRIEFEAAMRASAIPFTWECHRGNPEDIVTEHFRCSDLALVRQSTPGEIGGHPHMINHVLLNTGRPVMVIPYIGSRASLGDRVILGWNSSVQSTRAVHDAIPLIRAAQWVHVIDVDKNINTQTPGAGVPITQHLSRHGITAQTTTYPNSEIDVGDVLINHAADHGADLIVAGAWGHTRAHEYVFGGTTRTLLEHMTVPVLFSH